MNTWWGLKIFSILYLTISFSGSHRIGITLICQQLTFETKEAKFIYEHLCKKGADHFRWNYKEVFHKAGFDRKNDHVLLNVGQNLIAEKKADLAIALYEIYIREFPQVIVARNDLGIAFLLKGDTIKARACFQKTLELRPGNERAQELLKSLKQ